MKTLFKVMSVLVVLAVMGAGVSHIPTLARLGLVRAENWLDTQYNQMFVKRIVVTENIFVEKEPEYCDGVCGLLTKHAKKQGVPVAVVKAVAMQEGGHDFSNLQVNCSNKFWAKSHRIQNCALGMMQLIPIFNDVEDPLSILGPENLEANIAAGAARLRADFESSRGTTTQGRWYNAFVKYYGADQDGYPSKVMALVTKYALEANG